MRSTRHLFLALPLALSVLLLRAPAATAEFYISGYVGESFTQNSDVTLKDTTFNLNATLNSVSFDNSFMGGGKVGYWLGFFPNLGIEVDLDRFIPNIDQQTVSTSVSSLGLPAGVVAAVPPRVTLGVNNPVTATFGGFPFTTPVAIDKADLSVMDLGFHVVGRLRFLQDSSYPNGRLQPYLGAGPAVFFSSMRLKPFHNVQEDSTDLGVDALAGVKYFVHKYVSVFAEYKFSHFSTNRNFDLSFNGLRTTNVSMDLNTHQIYGGIAVHFDVH